MKQVKKKYDGDLISQEEIKKDTFDFSPFANRFLFHIDNDIEEIKQFTISYLNKNFPNKAPFKITRIETKKPHPGITKLNPYVKDDLIFICFEPLINTKWD